MQIIITATGKEFTVSWMGVATIDGILRFSVKDADMGEVFSTFTNQEETETLIHSFDNIQKEYTGYTVFRGITIDFQNEMIVSLSKI